MPAMSSHSQGRSQSAHASDDTSELSAIGNRCEGMALDVPAVLLVGGMGTRLRSVVPNRPKPLATVGDNSFLELLIRQLRGYGIRRIVMCTGYLGDQIEVEFKDGLAWDVAIEYSREASPMGTGGAIKLAEEHLQEASDFIVMNGDSFLEADLARLIQFHRERGAIATVAAVRVDNAGRYGTIKVESDGRVVGFIEKSGCELPGLINGGVYVLRRSALKYFPKGAASLEKEIFPLLVGQGLYALEQKGIFIDIGTPDDYRAAQKLCDRLYAAADTRSGVSI